MLVNDFQTQFTLFDLQIVLFMTLLNELALALDLLFKTGNLAFEIEDLRLVFYLSLRVKALLL